MSSQTLTLTEQGVTFAVTITVNAIKPATYSAPGLSPVQEQILAQLRERGEMPKQAIIRLLGVSEATTRRHMTHLISLDLVRIASGGPGRGHDTVYAIASREAA